MERLASHFTLAALLSLPVAACGDDTTPGGGGSGTGTGTGTAGSSTDNVTNATMPTTDNMTSGATSGSSGTTDPTGLDSTGGSGSTSGTGTTTGAADCDMCVADNCGQELMDCAAEPDCQCWLDCLAEGNNPPQCGQKCNGMPPGELGDLNDCINDQCDAECNGDPTTGGMGDQETYNQCMDNGDCPMTDCSQFLGYCSLDCMGDDNNCPIPATGDVQPICGGQDDNRCILPCGGGDTCPDGMMCNQGGGPSVCMYN